MTTFLKALPSNTEGRDFVCGDLHGMYNLLMEELNKVNFDQDEDRLFSVGDLIDRGPDSMRCLSLLHETWFFATQGNHDRMLLCYLGITPSLYHTGLDFIRNGGGWILDKTITKYMLDDWANAIEEKMPIVFDVGGNDVDNGFIVTHARQPDSVPLNYAQIDDIVWDRSLFHDIHEEISDEQRHVYKVKTQQFFQMSDRNPDEKVVFVGHNTLPKGHNLFVSNHMMLDSGAYHIHTDTLDSGARLTVLEVKPFLDSLK